MSIQIPLILAACLAVTMAVPAQDRAVQAVTSGVNQFSSAFFQEVGKGKSDNLITSPLSATIALSMAAYGSRGETEKEFKRVLHLPEESVARTGYANFIDSLNAVKNVELRLANKVYINKHFSVKPTFQELTQTAFRSTSETLNFAENVQAANTINQWCEEQTNHRIKDLIKPDKLSPVTAMVLVNAVYFKGNWANKFDQKLTKDKPFHVTRTQVKEVPTMHKVGNFRYGVLPDLKARFVELPYKGNELSMVIVLPDEVDGLAQVEKKLAQSDLNELLKNGYKTEVSLDLPKFKIESTLELNEHLKHMGLVKAFDQADADFSGISNTGVFISSVVQKAFIEVNEQGSEAAAATDSDLEDRFGTPDPVDVVTNKPFLAIIQKDGLSLFVAKVQEPKYRHSRTQSGLSGTIPSRPSILLHHWEEGTGKHYFVIHWPCFKLR